MYLNLLNDEEKKYFLELATYAANANGIVDEVERETINNYCREMGLKNSIVKELDSLDNLLSNLARSSEEIKKIVLLEIIGLCYSDGVIDLSEEAFSRKVAKGLGITDSVYATLFKDIEEYLIILKLINSHVFE